MKDGHEVIVSAQKEVMECAFLGGASVRIVWKAPLLAVCIANLPLFLSPRCPTSRLRVSHETIAHEKIPNYFMCRLFLLVNREIQLLHCLVVEHSGQQVQD